MPSLKKEACTGELKHKKALKPTEINYGKWQKNDFTVTQNKKMLQEVGISVSKSDYEKWDVTH